MVNLDEKILSFIDTFTKTNNYYPSYREVAAALNISTSTAWSHIDTLKKNGTIKKTESNKARALKLDGTAYLSRLEEEYLNNPTDYNKGRLDEARVLLA